LPADGAWYLNSTSALAKWTPRPASATESLTRTLPGATPRMVACARSLGPSITPGPETISTVGRDVGSREKLPAAQIEAERALEHVLQAEHATLGIPDESLRAGKRRSRHLDRCNQFAPGVS
jgi:hypothetical protein